jgi:hypothetical protein
MPRGAKPRTRIHPCMMSKSYNKSMQTISYHSEAHASEEGPLSTPRAASSEPNCVALITLFCSDRPRQLLVESSNRT